MNTTRTTPPLEELMTPQEVATKLRVVVRTLWRMVEDGRLPAPVRFSRKVVRFQRKVVDSYLAMVCEASQPSRLCPIGGCGNSIPPGTGAFLCTDHYKTLPKAKREMLMILLRDMLCADLPKEALVAEQMKAIEWLRGRPLLRE
jgi:excisionase family DNA binding protein